MLNLFWVTSIDLMASETSEERCFSFTPSFVRWLKIEPTMSLRTGCGSSSDSVTSMLSSNLAWDSFSALLRSALTLSRARLMFSSLGMKSLPAHSSNPHV